MAASALVPVSHQGIGNSKAAAKPLLLRRRPSRWQQPRQHSVLSNNGRHGHSRQQRHRWNSSRSHSRRPPAAAAAAAAAAVAAVAAAAAATVPPPATTSRCASARPASVELAPPCICHTHGNRTLSVTVTVWLRISECVRCADGCMRMSERVWRMRLGNSCTNSCTRSGLVESHAW